MTFYFYEHSLQSFFGCIHFQILQSWLLKKLTWIQIFDTFFTQRCKVALDNIATLLGVVNICKVSYLSLNFFLILENKYIVHSSNFKISWGSKNLQILHPKIKQEGHLYCTKAKKNNSTSWHFAMIKRRQDLLKSTFLEWAMTVTYRKILIW